MKVRSRLPGPTLIRPRVLSEYSGCVSEYSELHAGRFRVLWTLLGALQSTLGSTLCVSEYSGHYPGRFRVLWALLWAIQSTLGVILGVPEHSGLTLGAAEHSGHYSESTLGVFSVGPPLPSMCRTWLPPPRGCHTALKNSVQGESLAYLERSGPESSISWAHMGWSLLKKLSVCDFLT